MADQPDRPVLIVTNEHTLRRLIDSAVAEALAKRERAPARLLDAAEAGDVLGVTAATALKWAREKGLPHRRLGPREVRFVEAEILEWGAERKAS